MDNQDWKSQLGAAFGIDLQQTASEAPAEPEKKETAQEQQGKKMIDIILDKKTKREKQYSIVGEKEIDPLQGRISLKSPIGTALVGKKQGETVQVQAPRGTITYEILEVKY